jgi:hypothetical protein
MPTDFKLTEDRDIDIDPTGDIATVSGNDNIEQQHANALFRAGRKADTGSLNTQNARRNLYDAVETELEDLHYVGLIRTINVERLDHRTFHVEVETDVLNEPLEQEVIS